MGHQMIEEHVELTPGTINRDHIESSTHKTASIAVDTW